MDIATLRSAYLCGQTSPSEQVERCLAQRQEPDWTGLWIALVVEVWRLPVRHYGSFVALIPSPLGIGRIELEDGSWVQGFLCESWALAGAAEISRFGGWRGWRAQRCREGQGEP